MKSFYKNVFLWCCFFVALVQLEIFPTDLCGNVSGILDIAGSPYIVTCNILVPDGQTLTIEPGVEIKFDPGYVLQVNGTLIAEGTAGGFITFTSNVSVPAAGDWGEIYFSESENSSFELCVIEYAGAGASPQTALNLWRSNVSIHSCLIRKTLGSGINISESSPIITNCDIVDNTGIGVVADVTSFPTISGGDISDNGDYAILLSAHSVGNISGVVIAGNSENSIRVEESGINSGNWENHDVPYIIGGNIVVNDGQTLTINPGNELKFTFGHSMQILGTLIAEGTPGNKIKFTTATAMPSAGDWGKLNFTGSEDSRLKHCIVEYAGGSANPVAILLDASSVLIDNTTVQQSNAGGIIVTNNSITTISSSTIEENSGIGIDCDVSSTPIINDCEISHNGDYAVSLSADNVKNIFGSMLIIGNSENSIRVENQVVNSGTWRNFLVPYIITGNISVADGETLILEPGVELRFNGDYIFEVNGALVAEGSANNYIIFTSNQDIPAPGNWRYLSFNLSDPATNLNYCKVLYAGSNTAALNITFSNFSITNTIVKYSAQSGIYLTQSSPLIRSCTIEENLSHGVYINSGSPNLGTSNNHGDNIFRLNSGWEVYNNTADTIYAVENFWVTTDSAAIDNNHIYDDDENASKGIVVFMPFLKTIPTEVEEIQTQPIPQRIALVQNYPNPFNPSTTISFSIPDVSIVLLKVFNSLGEEIEVLVAEELKAGNYKYVWDAKNFTSGVYFYQLQAESFSEIKKMVLLK